MRILIDDTPYYIYKKETQSHSESFFNFAAPPSQNQQNQTGQSHNQQGQSRPQSQAAQKKIEMFNSLTKAVSLYKAGQTKEAIDLAMSIYGHGHFLLQNETIDYNNHEHRMIVDRIMATSSWLAKWTSDNPPLSMKYTQDAYQYSLGLNGPTNFWTVVFLHDLGSRSLDLGRSEEALNYYMAVITQHTKTPHKLERNSDQVSSAYANAVSIMTKLGQFDKALTTAQVGLLNTTGEHKKTIEKYIAYIEKIKNAANEQNNTSKIDE